MTMTAKTLREALADVPDDTVIVLGKGMTAIIIAGGVMDVAYLEDDITEDGDGKFFEPNCDYIYEDFTVQPQPVFRLSNYWD